MLSTVSAQTPTRDQKIVLRYFLSCLGFGLAMGAAFPVFASFFVTYRSEAAGRVFTLGCLAAGFIVGFLAFLIGRLTLLRTMGRVAGRLGELADAGGDLRGDIELSSSDVVGRLAGSFNAFLAKMRRMLRSLARVSESTQSVGFELAANATETSAASEQISRHMDMVHEQTGILLGEIGRVSEASDGIRGSAADVSDNINRQSDSLTRLSSSIENIVADFKALSEETRQRTSAIVSSLAESDQSLGIIEQSTQRIRHIAESVQGIAEWAGAIGDIAQNISLLGMNASIEAAHAGQAGRGFAVVAGEIGKLSVLVGQKSAEIDKGLKEVVARVESGVAFSEANQGGLARLFRRIEESTEAIGTVSDRFAQIASRADEMLAAHNDLVKVTIDVTDSTVRMRDGTNDIEASVDVLLETSDRYKGAIEEISLGIREIAADVAHLNKLSETNAENARLLEAEVAKFSL